MWNEQGKTRLEIFMHFKGIDEVAGMNALQGRGIISDNCERAADVAESNIQRAVDFLTPHNERRCERCGVPISKCCCC